MRNDKKIHHKGVTLIELMVAMAIGLIVVAVVTLIYVQTNQSQKSEDKQNSVKETGAYVLQILGRDIKMAGFYPATVPPITNGTPVPGANAKNGFMASTQTNMYETYPPLPSNPQMVTDWISPAVAYTTGIYGCEGGQFDSRTGTCPTPDSSKSDSIVINWFSSDAMGSSLNIGNRRDCTGSDITNDPSNAQRKINSGTAYDASIPPRVPLFGSNRYSLKTAASQVDGAPVSSFSLACSGNGASWQGVVGVYQPAVPGLLDMQFEYGVYTDSASVAPAIFYKADDISSMPVMTINGQAYSGWQRVIAVKICVLSQSVGGGARISTASRDAPSYIDCAGNTQTMPVGQWIKRDYETFGVRNNLTQSY